MDTTVAKGLAVLEALARENAPMRLSALTAELGFQKSNVHRLLNTLILLGYVEQEPESGRYSASLKLWELGAPVIANHPAKRAAAPFMRDLHKATSETVSLTVLEGGEVLYLEKLLSPRPLRFSTQAGSRAPALLTASGKAMLAFVPDARLIVEKTIASVDKARAMDVEAVIAEFAVIRARGWAESDGAWTPGLIAVAAPVMARNGQAAAALTVSGPTERIDATKRAKTIEAVLNTCAKIAETVGKL